jgi:hypothetical protein
MPLGATSVAGRVAITGEPYYGAPGRRDARRDAPAFCVPLRFKDRPLGVIAVWELLQQKTELAEVDYELFQLLGAHAAAALEAARLAHESEGKPHLGLARLALQVQG